MMITATGVEPAAHPPRPLARHIRIEADQFCACGYNLHGQDVARDERLGFEVVRCPECGKWHPAGHGSTATRPWLARLAAVLLVVWCLIIVAAGVASTGAIFGFHFGITMHDSATVDVDTTNGRPVTSVWNPTTGASEMWYRDTEIPADRQQYGQTPIYIQQPGGGIGVVPGNPPALLGTAATTQPAAPAEPQIAPSKTDPAAAEVDRPDPVNVEWRQVPGGHPLVEYAYYYQEPSAWEMGIIWGTPMLIALIGGVLQSVLLWHLGVVPRYVLAAVLMLLPAAIAVAIIHLVPDAIYLRSTFVRNSAVLFGITLLLWAIGVTFGRVLGRGLVGLLIPPRPRQFLSFLWAADGKQMPLVTEAA